MIGFAGVRNRLPVLWAGQGGAVARVLMTCAAPLEWGFRAAVAVRGAWYDVRGGSRAPLPVVSIGNLTVGGTGKTPLLRALWQWAEGEGARAAVVTRGYGADEVALYRKWFGVDRVFVSPSRLEGVHRAQASGLDLALIDDGFQHRALARDVDVLLVAAEGPFPLRLLPRGPYREPLRAAKRASLVVVTSRTGAGDVTLWRERLRRAAPEVETCEVALGARGWVDPWGMGQPAPTGSILAVASTATPRTFGATVEKLLPNSTVELMPFPDHHDYSLRDVSRVLEAANGREIATTEKDAVKLAAFPDMEGRYSVVDFGVVQELPDPLTGALTALLQTRP